MSINSKTDASSNIYADINDLRRLQFQAKGFSFLPNQPANSVLSGKNVSKLRGRGLNFEELRHYRPGDDIRSMDWKVTRRTGKPHVKVYTEERERNVYMAIDQRSTMFFGSKAKMKSVVATELAALIAWRITDSGDRVGAIIYNDDEVKVIPAKRGRQHVVSLLAELVKINHQLKAKASLYGESDPFNKMLAKLNKVVGNNALVLLIGDGHGWSDQSTEHIKKLRQHNELIACHVYDPLELKLPEMAQMVVSDGEQQIQFSSKNSKIKKRYQEEIDRQLQSYASTAKKYRIPFILIDTVSKVEQQLRKALGKLV